MSTDAIVLLKADHQQIREQFRRFTAAGENATAAKGRIVDKIIELLTVHTHRERSDELSRANWPRGWNRKDRFLASQSQTARTPACGRTAARQW